MRLSKSVLLPKRLLEKLLMFTENTPGLHLIANQLKDQNDHLRSANQKLIVILNNLKRTALTALEPIDLMVMSDNELRLYEMLKTL